MKRKAESDISIKELILTIKSYISEILRSWLTMCVFGFGFALFLLIIKFNVKPMYRAHLSYMLNEDESGGLAGLAGMLGQFGLGGGGAESNFDKIVELSRTRKITQNALFEKRTVQGKEDYLANHLIESLKYIDKWGRKDIFSFLAPKDTLKIKDFKFTHDSIEAFSILENKALKATHKAMVGKELKGGYFKSEYSEITGILSISMTSPYPDMSIETVESMYANLHDYYVEKTVEKQKNDYQLIKSKYDSITTTLSATQYQLARSQDRNQGFYMSEDKLAESKLAEDERRLQMMLGEAEKQKQIAELTLGNKTPYIQLIDRPILPLRPVNKGKIYYFLLGGLIGGFLGVTVIVLRRLYRDIMAE